MPNALRLLDIASKGEGGEYGRLDDHGDLWVDERLVAAAWSRWTRDLSVARVRLLGSRAEAHLHALDGVAVPAPVEGNERAGPALLEAGAVVAGFMPCPILAKSIVGGLLDLLRANGYAGGAPAPEPSPGAQLVADLGALAARCESAGWSPSEVRSAWPVVPDPIRRAVVAFAASHAGYGPLAWDAPGLEDPRLVVQSLAYAQPASSAAAEARQPDSLPTSPLGLALYDALRSWLELTERGILLVRRAFFSGMRPLVIRYAGESGVVPVHVLFMRAEEISTGPPPPGVLEGRMRLYLDDGAYLTKNGIGDGRLDSLVALP